MNTDATIKYKIIEVYPDEQLIVVRYYSDTLPEKALASMVDADGNMVRCRTDVSISLPIPTPNAADLDKLIMLNCPVGFFAMKQCVADPLVDTSLSSIRRLQGVEMVRKVSLAPPTLVADAVPNSQRMRPTEHRIEVL